MTFKPLRILSVSALISIHALAGQDDWNFTWPTVTSQCETVAISITGGVPPWELEILYVLPRSPAMCLTFGPIGQQPLFWNVPGPDYPFNASYPFTASIPLQLESGTAYVVIIYDSQWYNEAPFNPTPIQIVQPSDDTACLASAIRPDKDFDFQVYGILEECGFLSVAWRNTSSNSSGIVPYSFTIAPLDALYNPWDVLITEARREGNVAIARANMTIGARFTVMLNGGENDRAFIGRGGVGQIYEVSLGGNANCISQQSMNRAVWPAGLQVNPVSPTETARGPLPTPTPNNNNSTDIPNAQISPPPPSPPPNPSPAPKGIGAGAIAGIAVGAAAVTVAIIAPLLFYIRRKRRQNRAAHQENVDLVEGSGGGAGHVEPKVVPFRSTSTSGPMPPTGYNPSRTQNGYRAGETVQTDPDFGVHGVDTHGSVPFPTPGPGVFGPAGEPGSSTDTQSEVRDQGPTSPHVAPSPDKKAPQPPHPLPPIPRGSLGQIEFRRHSDAGEIPDQGRQQGGVVDLPYLYTDVPARRAGTQPQQQLQQQ